MGLDQLLSSELYLRLLENCTHATHASLIETAPDIVILCICSCAHNILKRNVFVNAADLELLRQNRSILYSIANTNQKLRTKRKLLRSKKYQTVVRLAVRLVLTALDSGELH